MMSSEGSMKVKIILDLYRVIKKSLCTDDTIIKHTSFLLHYLAQFDCLTADRQGQGDTRLTPNSNYVIMVSD
jgi:hypothetical protein